MHCTVENCLQLLQVLIVSLLMLHINIIGVVTCSDNSTSRIVTCIIRSFQFISLSHYTVPLLQRQRHNTRKKINKMLSILVDNAAANEQLTVDITSNFPQYC